MSSHGTHTHWQMTINNYDETDLALLRQGYPDHIRQLVYTLETGEEGTPHIQAFIKMKRDCRLTHMKKLFPRGHFQYLDSSEYKLNAQRYAQKLDATADGPATITNGDPLHTIEGSVRTIINLMISDGVPITEVASRRGEYEYIAVMEDYSMAKVFVSATYKAMWKDWGTTMFRSLLEKADTHTHTHTADEQSVDIPVYQQDERGEFLREEEDDDETSSSSEGSCASGESSSGSEDGSEESDCSQYGGQGSGLVRGEERPAQQRYFLGRLLAPRANH